MRRIGLHRNVAPGPDVERGYPGMARATALRLDHELKAILSDARRDGVAFATKVMHVETDRLRWRSRAEVVSELREAGVAKLAKELERAVVPVGSFLGLVDTEGVTAVRVVPLSAALEETTELAGGGA